MKKLIKIEELQNCPCFNLRLMARELTNEYNNLMQFNGIIQLMDTAYKNSKIFLKKPSYQTLIIIPVVDEIVPRKPLLNLLENADVYGNLNNNLYLAVYDKNFHMILRDSDGDRISREIKEWITNKKDVTNLHTFINPIQRLKNSEFYHKLD